MAAKLDKKLAKKLAKMSEEERKAFLEEQRRAEEEMKLKKEEMLSRFLKDKLEREHKSGKINQMKLQSKWRDVMRQAKTEELRKDIEVLSQTFERVVDCKDAVIKSLMRDIEESEWQYHRALQGHLDKVNGLIEFQLRRLQEREETFQEEVGQLQMKFDKERAMLRQHHQQEMQDLQDIAYAMELRFSEQESETLMEFQGLVDEIKNKNLEERHALKVQRQGQIDELWQEFQQEAEQYRKNTEEQKMRFEFLKKKDESSSKQIHRQMKRVDKLQSSIAQVKAKVSSAAREFEEKSQQIKENKDVVIKRFRELKEEMLRSREAERSKLTALTMQSSAAIKQLKQHAEKGDAIVRLSEMCRKLETEEEKVLPFYKSSLSEKEERQLEATMAEPPPQKLAQVMYKYTALERFWKRYNKVLLDKLALDKEKQSLMEENQQLKALLKQYLDGISVNDDILSQTNPLLVVNHRTNAPVPVPVGDTRVRKKAAATIVEAAHVVKHIL